MIYSLQEAINTKINMKGHAYWETVQAARDVPVETSLHSMRYALKKHKQSEAEERLQDYEFTEIHPLVGNDHKRFQFIEHYELLSDIDPSNYATPLTDHFWERVPSTAAMRMMPPTDVSFHLYEAEAMRRIPLAHAVTRVVGRSPQLTATTPSEIAAHSAYEEVYQYVLSQQTPMTGATIDNGPPAKQASTLTKAACAVISACYGTKAGLTLVDGDDELWSCLPAGNVARLVLRHLNLFAEAELQRLSVGSDPLRRVRVAAEMWRSTRRHMADAFVAELKAFAAAHLKQNAPVVFDRRLNAIEAVRSFHRVSALSAASNAVVPGLAVASQFHVYLSSVVSDAGSADVIQSAVEVSEAAARQFRDQRNMPTPGALGRRTTWVAGIASWASKRLDAAPARTWKFSGKSGSVDALIKQLVKTSLDEKQRLYYSPVGGALSALPSVQAFGVDALASRLVWLSIMQDMCVEVRGAVRKASEYKPRATSPYNIRTTLLRGHTSAKYSGLARHPLTMAVDGDEVKVCLAAPIAVVRAPGNAPKTVMDALLQIREGRATAAQLESASLAMRTLAYNADRMLNALDLSAEGTAAGGTINIYFEAPEHVAALCLALALLQNEKPSLQLATYVYVKDNADGDPVSATTEMLERIVSMCASATEKGCKAVSLAEACVCFV